MTRSSRSGASSAVDCWIGYGVQTRVKRNAESMWRSSGKLLGRLQYRTSYGQNVLRHLVESAHIAGSLAAEIGVDPTVAKRGAFLHDIGKAVTHEVEGSHAIIGAEIARRLGESPEVVHCIESHHGEVEQHTIDAVLAQIADGTGRTAVHAAVLLERATRGG